MRYLSLFANWYYHIPTVKYDFCSSGLSGFRHSFVLDDIDLSASYSYGNPELAELLARRYAVRSENIFCSGEGTSGQNVRLIRCLAERNEKKNEAIVEFPVYEPLLRQVQEYFPHLKRLERKKDEAFRLDADRLRKIVSERTGLLVLTNPHAPSGATASRSELKQIMDVAAEHDFYVLCDEIYAEFDRQALPTAFSVNSDFGIVTTSFTKAYGLSGLKLGIALAGKDLVDSLQYRHGEHCWKQSEHRQYCSDSIASAHFYR